MPGSVSPSIVISAGDSLRIKSLQQSRKEIKELSEYARRLRKKVVDPDDLSGLKDIQTDLSDLLSALDEGMDPESVLGGELPDIRNALDSMASKVGDPERYYPFSTEEPEEKDEILDEITSLRSKIHDLKKERPDKKSEIISIESELNHQERAFEYAKKLKDVERVRRRLKKIRSKLRAVEVSPKVTSEDLWDKAVEDWLDLVVKFEDSLKEAEKIVSDFDLNRMFVKNFKEAKKRANSLIKSGESKAALNTLKAITARISSLHSDLLRFTDKQSVSIEEISRVTDKYLNEILIRWCNACNVQHGTGSSECKKCGGGLEGPWPGGVDTATEEGRRLADLILKTKGMIEDSAKEHLGKELVTRRDVHKFKREAREILKGYRSELFALTEPIAKGVLRKPPSEIYPEKREDTDKEKGKTKEERKGKDRTRRQKKKIKIEVEKRKLKKTAAALITVFAVSSAFYYLWPRISKISRKTQIRLKLLLNRLRTKYRWVPGKPLPPQAQSELLLTLESLNKKERDRLDKLLDKIKRKFRSLLRKVKVRIASKEEDSFFVGNMLTEIDLLIQSELNPASWTDGYTYNYVLPTGNITLTNPFEVDGVFNCTVSYYSDLSDSSHSHLLQATSTDDPSLERVIVEAEHRIPSMLLEEYTHLMCAAQNSEGPDKLYAERRLNQFQQAYRRGSFDEAKTLSGTVHG